MLSFEHKRAIFASFPELAEKKISNGRINFIYHGSKRPGKVLATQLHLSGNGYVCGKYMEGYKTDERGWIKIKNYSQEQLRQVIKMAIDSMSV